MCCIFDPNLNKIQCFKQRINLNVETIHLFFIFVIMLYILNNHLKVLIILNHFSKQLYHIREQFENKEIKNFIHLLNTQIPKIHKKDYLDS